MRKLKTKKDPMPRRVQPMLAKLVSAPFSGDEWVFEPKLDGIRAIAYQREGELTLLTRRGLDLGGRYPRVESALLEQNGDSYQPGLRTGSWLKIKTTLTSEFIICGFMAGAGARDGTFGSLILGYNDAEGNLVYAGRVGTGFNDSKLKDLMQRMKPLRQKSSPFSPEDSWSIAGDLGDTAAGSRGKVC